MDDMTAFERQIGDELRHEIGPLPRFDAIKIVRTTTSSPKWRFQTMFSATKFVLAGAIVALFGGFLLAGVLTQQPSDDRVPAVGASASAEVSPTDVATTEPEPTTDVEADDTSTTPVLLPGVDLVTEEVEPGVFRVLNDGVRELSRPADEASWMGGSHDTNIVAGLDGSVWWFGPDGFFRLGGEATHEWHEDRWTGTPIGLSDFEVGPDGTLWLQRWPGRNAAFVGNGSVWSFDGASWTTRRQGAETELGYGVEVQEDGTVWTAWFTDWERGKGGNVIDPEVGEAAPNVFGTAQTARLGEDGWEVLPGAVEGDQEGDLAVAQDGGGEVWLLPSWPGPLYRHDGEGWVVQPTPGAPDVSQVSQVAVGVDGTVWTRLQHDILGRFDGDDWEVYDAADGIPVLGSHLEVLLGFFEVGPDRSIWFTKVGKGPAQHCDGVAVFDGQAVTSYLQGHCITAMDVAPDGAVWLRGGEFSGDWDRPVDPSDTYVITPEAVAGIE